ncbi:spindly [Carabus blaptoides fortunei]
MFSDLSNNVVELKECINSSKQELQSSSDLVHDLQDEIVVLHMELQQFRNGSLDNDIKANSLFAEVDDNRLKLKENVQILNKNYMDIKTKYNNMRQELQKLHSEYASLTKIVENKKKLQESYCQLTESYKRHFNNLSEILKRLENEIELRNWANSKILSGEMKCVEELISITRKEVLNLQKEVNSESLARTMSEQSLCETKREARKWQTEAIQNDY